MEIEMMEKPFYGIAFGNNSEPTGVKLRMNEVHPSHSTKAPPSDVYDELNDDLAKWSDEQLENDERIFKTQRDDYASWIGKMKMEQYEKNYAGLDQKYHSEILKHYTHEYNILKAKLARIERSKKRRALKIKK